LILYAISAKYILPAGLKSPRVLKTGEFGDGQKSPALKSPGKGKSKSRLDDVR
jgi:hypothetical protein